MPAVTTDAGSSVPAWPEPRTPRPRLYTLQLWFAFFSIYIFYGANFVGISEVVHHGLPVVSNVGFRYCLAGLLTLAVLGARGHPIGLSRAHLLSTASCGVMCLGVFGFVSLAEKHVSPGAAALLLASVPLLVIGMRIGVDRERMPLAIIASVIVGFIGVAIVVVSEGGGTGGTVVGMALIMITALGLATGTFLIPKLSMPPNSLVSGAWQLLWGGLALLIAGAAAGEWGSFHISAVSSNAWLAYAYLTSFGTFATYLSFVWLLKRVPVSLVAASGYVNPIVAVIVGAALAGQKLTTAELIGGAVIVVSVAVVIARDRVPVEGVGAPGLEPPGEPVRPAADGPPVLAPRSVDERGK